MHVHLQFAPKNPNKCRCVFATECVLLLNTAVQTCFEPATQVHPQDVMNQMVHESDVPVAAEAPVRRRSIAAASTQQCSAQRHTFTAAHAVMCDHTRANV
jgi:hypothetical protein